MHVQTESLYLPLEKLKKEIGPAVPANEIPRDWKRGRSGRVGKELD